MGASANDVLAVIGFDIKEEAAPINLCELDPSFDFEPGGSGSLMADVDVRSQALFVGPVKIRMKCLDAGPFEQAY